VIGATLRFSIAREENCLWRKERGVREFNYDEPRGSFSPGSKTARETDRLGGPMGFRNFFRAALLHRPFPCRTF